MLCKRKKRVCVFKFHKSKCKRMLTLNSQDAKKAKIAIFKKFWTTVQKAENFRVLRGVISFKTLVGIGILVQKKHSSRVPILEKKGPKKGLF